MFNKINKELEEFTTTIKEVEGCDKMLTYINSGIYSGIKLLMFASKTFSLYIRILMFFIIALTGLTLMSSFGIGTLNIPLVLITLALFVLILVYIMHFKNILILNIEKSKNNMKKEI